MSARRVVPYAARCAAAVSVAVVVIVVIAGSLDLGSLLIGVPVQGEERGLEAGAGDLEVGDAQRRDGAPDVGEPAGSIAVGADHLGGRPEGDACARRTPPGPRSSRRRATMRPRAIRTVRSANSSASAR